VLSYLWETSGIVEKSPVKYVFPNHLLVDSNESLFNTRVIDFRRKINSILQQLHVRSFCQMEVVGLYVDLRSFRPCIFEMCYLLEVIFHSNFSAIDCTGFTESGVSGASNKIMTKNLMEKFFGCIAQRLVVSYTAESTTGSSIFSTFTCSLSTSNFPLSYLLNDLFE
jgi:hypothetical protein